MARWSAPGGEPSPSLKPSLPPAEPILGGRGPSATSTPATSTAPPTSSAGVGRSPSSSHAEPIDTGGTSRIHGTTEADGLRESNPLKIA
ncbi:hypothetical protein [Nocardioides sp. MH1]|uniref:hypothetical protein n=1 Tax=Nocardioides sp. MH1 TaxID=3242490 RepID=UPI0035210756